MARTYPCLPTSKGFKPQGFRERSLTGGHFENLTGGGGRQRAGRKQSGGCGVGAGGLRGRPWKRAVGSSAPSASPDGRRPLLCAAGWPSVFTCGVWLCPCCLFPFISLSLKDGLCLTHGQKMCLQGPSSESLACLTMTEMTGEVAAAWAAKVIVHAEGGGDIQ